MTEAGVVRREGEKRDPGATRRALLGAGAVLFAERGFAGVSIEDLAARAGVNKALISYHFRGKRGLYSAILAATFRELAERIDAVEAQAEDARAALHGLVSVFDAFRREHPTFPRLFMREVLESGVEPLVVPHLLTVIGVVRRIAARGRREGTLRPVDPLLMHFGLIGALVFFAATEPARRRAAAEGRIPFAMPEFPDFLRYVEELTVRGLAPHPRDSRRHPRRPIHRKSKGARS